MLLKEKKYRLLDYFVFSFIASPLYSIIRIADTIIYALLPSAMVMATSEFINTALEIFSGNKERNAIYLSLLMLMVVIAYKNLDFALVNFANIHITTNLNTKYRLAIIEKRAKLEYRYIEKDDTWEIINRVCTDPVVRVFNGFDALLRLLSMIIQICSLLVVLFSQVWWAGLVIIGFCVPLFYLSIKGGKTNYDAFREATKYERRAKYLNEVLTGRDSVDERTLFGFEKNVNKKWYEKFEIARMIKLKVEAKNFIRMKGASLITVLISFLISIVLIAPLGSGELSIGMFIGLITAILSIVQMVSFDLSAVTSEIANNREYMHDLSEFVSFSEQVDVLNVPVKCQNEVKKLEFRNVNFRYPGTDKLILDDCSFVIHQNANYAFVGINGAGKTTITKLLTGLYTNYEGKILVNDRDIRGYTQSELKGLFAVVYQDFAKYSLSIKDNIALGNINNWTEQKITEAIHLVEFDEKIHSKSKGIDTYLGKIKENGIDLSGGEWQKIAIARLLINDAPISILDEPTAALDPMAESEVYEMFKKVSVGKTVIFITHRLGAARLADKIFVLNKGKVTEEGSHDELMKIGGMYSEMYESQRGWYE